MSESAHGQFAQTIIFQSYKGKTYAKKYSFPNLDLYPPTMPQLAIQATTKALMQHWKEIPTVDQATWSNLATADRISRINAYLRENYRRLRSGQAATDVWPAEDGPAIAGILAIVEPGIEATCYGDYEQIADMNGYPAFKKTTPYDGSNYYYIFWSNGTGYVLQDGTNEPPSPFAVAMRTDPEGEWLDNQYPYAECATFTLS